MQYSPDSQKGQTRKKEWIIPAVEMISLGGGNSGPYHEATYFTGSPGNHHFAHTANHSPAPETLFTFFYS